jgi:Domain of unknown function (DUF4402)
LDVRFTAKIRECCKECCKKVPFYRVSPTVSAHAQPRRISVMKFDKKYLALGVLGALAASSAAYATAPVNSQTVTATVTFKTALNLSVNAGMDFGEIAAGTSGVYVLNSNTGAVSITTPGEIIGGSPHAGSLTVTGDGVASPASGSDVTISVGSYIASADVTLSAATCTYGTVHDTACDSGAPLATGQTALTTGTTFTVGATATVTGSAAVGVESPSMVVTITYS